MPTKDERPRKMADSQTYAKISKSEKRLRFLGYVIMTILIVAMLIWTVCVFLM